MSWPTPNQYAATKGTDEEAGPRKAVMLRASQGAAAAGKGLVDLGSQQALVAPARWDCTADLREDNSQSTHCWWMGLVAFVTY